MITFEETVQVVINLLKRAEKAEDRVAELEQQLQFIRQSDGNKDKE
jgi:hypothetical protein